MQVEDVCLSAVANDCCPITCSPMASQIQTLASGISYWTLRNLLVGRAEHIPLARLYCRPIPRNPVFSCTYLLVVVRVFAAATEGSHSLLGLRHHTAHQKSLDRSPGPKRRLRGQLSLGQTPVGGIRGLGRCIQVHQRVFLTDSGPYRCTNCVLAFLVPNTYLKNDCKSFYVRKMKSRKESDIPKFLEIGDLRGGWGRRR